tara:strand:- start:37 stop:303 length:267 start_codon:yes stop_codon:yes gene_type:complete
MKVRKGKKKAIEKLIRIVGDEELTTKQIYERMLMQTSPTSDLTFRQLTNVLGAYFDKVGFDKKTTCIIWRNKNEQEQISKEQNNKDAK